MKLRIDPTAMVELNRQLQKWRPNKVIQPNGSIKAVFRGQRLEGYSDRATHCWDRVLHATTATVDSPSPECVLNSLRPAYLRDHHWLKWETEKSWKNAKIREEWDALSDERRKRICPECWRKVGSKGRGTVKQGIRKAKSEKKR